MFREPSFQTSLPDPSFLIRPWNLSKIRTLPTNSGWKNGGLDCERYRFKRVYRVFLLARVGVWIRNDYGCFDVGHV